MTSNATLLQPYQNSTKYCGISLKNIEHRTLGISSPTANPITISHALYGIYAENAGFTLLHTEMHDIWDNPTNPNNGSCILSNSAFDYTNRKMEIGDGTTNGSNYFYSSLNGIKGVGEMNYYINENIFGTNTGTQRLRNSCIRIENNGSMDIEIQDENVFYDFTWGIRIINPFGRIFIDNNFFWNAVTPHNPGTFIGTAIQMAGFSNQRLSDAVISFNHIGGNSSTQNDQARIGISLSMLDHVKILNNDINFTLSSPTDPYRGIWATNCAELKLDQNTITNNNTLVSPANDDLTGVRIEDCMNSCIENTTLNNMGYGMSFYRNSVVQSFYQNTFTNFDEGIHLTDADIGPTIGTEDPPNSGSGNVMGNEWNLCSSCTTTTKIMGNINNPLTWYTEVLSGARFPDNNVVGLSVDQLSTFTVESECQLPIAVENETDYGNTMTLRKRNETFGSVVADTVRYMEEFAQEFRYLAREAVFKTLRKHPGLMVRDDDSDTSFVNFYTTMLGSNTYLIDSLQTLINNRQFVEADTLLARFTEENDQEYNYKKVYAATILWMVNGEEAIDDVLREELDAIAHQHPVYGGYAVYLARNLLQLEIYDAPLSSSRLMAPKKTISQRKLNVYPNPANEYIEVTFNDRSIPEEIILRDLTGRICSTLLNSAIVNTTTLFPGIYFVEVMAKGEKHNANIVVAR